MGTDTSTRWVLAFDASCAWCREVSQAVDRASRGRLEVLPLAHEDVHRWRERALGTDAPHAPTVIRAEGERVRAWTGVRMGTMLVWRLGPRRTIRVLRALGEVSSPAGGGDEPAGKLLGRRALFKLGAGLGVAGALVLSGRAPAFAEPRKLTAARAWARANRGPSDSLYDEFAAYPPDYRRVIFGEFSPSARSHLWSEHLTRYRSARPRLTGRQARVLDEAEAIVADESIWDRGPEARARVTELESAAVDALGCEEYLRALVDLGSPEAGATAEPEGLPCCACRLGSRCERCRIQGCFTCNDWPGCGCLNFWECDGCQPSQQPPFCGIPV
jgi:hypothetical protein